MKEFIQEQVELIENEFPNMSHEELYDTVWGILAKTNPAKYNKMSEVDKFDYMVDEILITQGILKRT